MKKKYFRAGGGHTVDDLEIVDPNDGELPEIYVYEVPDEYARDENWDVVANKATYRINSIDELDKIIKGLLNLRSDWMNLLHKD